MNLELVTNLLQRNVPDFVNDQVQFWIDMAQEAIRRDEREKIVNWLRDQDGHGYDDVRANCIEAGEHLK
jgi:hypothetical protein